MLVILLRTIFVSSLSAEEFLDAARLGDRGVIFEAPQVGRHIQGLTGVGDVDGDGFSDVLLSLRVEEPALAVQSPNDPYVSTAVLVFGRAGMSGKHTLASAL